MTNQECSELVAAAVQSRLNRQANMLVESIGFLMGVKECDVVESLDSYVEMVDGIFQFNESNVAELESMQKTAYKLNEAKANASEYDGWRFSDARYDA
jgi:hypothetical protein